jgi:MATE family multidrug resistance protein
MDGALQHPARELAETSPLAELLRLAGPTVLQMASYTLMQFIDTYLLARLGTLEAAAAAMSGLFAFSLMCFGIGVLQLVNTLVSQCYGRREYTTCGKYLWQGIWFGLAWSVVLLPLIPFAGGMFRTMGHDAKLADLEAVYLRLILISTAVKMASTALGQFLLAVDRPRVVFAAAVIAVACNVFTAYAMILGKWGAPKMGIVGAAWAQNIGVTIEALVLAVFAFQRPMREKFNSIDWHLRRQAFATLWRVGWPSGAQFIADVLAWSIFSTVVMAQAGEPAMVANMFTFRFMSVSFMPAIGIGTAVTALVGRYIGMGRPDIAVHRANLGFKVNALYMFTCGILFFLFRHQLMQLFTSDPQVLRIGAMLLIFAAVYQLADALYVSYTGALRGAGDTFIPAVATAVLNWSMTVALGFVIAKTHPQWGAIGPWVVATAYGLTLSTFMYLRFRRGTWKFIRLERQQPSDTVTPLGAQLATES